MRVMETDRVIRTAADLLVRGMSGVPGQVYLVTGGCGFLGKHLVQMLAERGEDVAEIRVFDLHLDRELESVSTESVTVRLIEGDLTEREQVSRAAEGVDLIFHLASIIDFCGGIPEATMQAVNVQGTRHVIDACVQHGIQSLVYTSTMEVVGPNRQWQHFYRGNEETKYNTCHSTAYCRTKAKAEKLILEANGCQVAGGKRLHTCALRPTGIYGEGFAILRALYERASRLGGRLVRFGPTTVQSGCVYVGNVAWMHLLAARALRENPELLGGQVYYCYDESPDKSYLDFNMEFLAPCGVRLIGQGRPLLPFALIYLLASLGELLQAALRPFYTFTPLLNRFTLALASTTFTVRTDKATRHFAYTPLFTWEESRGRTVRWLQELYRMAPEPGHL